MIDKLKNPVIKQIFKDTYQTSGNHFFNEVYIGGRWVRLDYAELGADSSHAGRGIYFQHYTMNDMSEIDLAGIMGEMTTDNNWGPFGNGELFMTLDLSDEYGKHFKPRYEYGINSENVEKYSADSLNRSGMLFLKMNTKILV